MVSICGHCQVPEQLNIEQFTIPTVEELHIYQTSEWLGVLENRVRSAINFYFDYLVLVI